MVKKSAKHIIKSNSIKLVTTPRLLFVVVVCIGLIFGGIWVKSYFGQQQNLRELDIVGKDLKVVYEKLLALNKGNVASSFLRNECSESSVKYGRGQITCGSMASVVIQKSLDLEQAKQQVESALREISYEIPTMLIDEGARTLDTKIVSNYNGIRCWLSYNQNQSTDNWIYHMYCMKDVPDFLPGYEIVK